MEKGKMQKDLVEQARQLRLQAEELERKVLQARGTLTSRVVGGAIVKPARTPYWVGDEGPTEGLMAVVRAMLEERPMMFQEILEACGARDNRVKGVIMRLQREGVRVVDVAPSGTGKALWFIPSAAVLERLTRGARSSARK